MCGNPFDSRNQYKIEKIKRINIQSNQCIIISRRYRYHKKIGVRGNDREIFQFAFSHRN